MVIYISNNKLGTTLRRRRVLAGFTLRELSLKSGISSTHIGRIERGERFPSAHTLLRIAKSLDLANNELLTLVGFLFADHPSLYRRP